MSDQVIYIDTRGPIRNGLMILALVLSLIATWFFVRWYIGSTLAEYLNPDDRPLQPAQMAAQLAPDDPLAHWQLAEVMQRALPQDQTASIVTEYEMATRLSPNDYRFWLSLGRALEQSGDFARAEQAMRRAVALAPAYAFPRWYLGNLLLRNGQEAEAFSEFHRAGDADSELLPQIFSLAWQLYDKNYDALKNAIGPAVHWRAEFVKYLIGRSEFDTALRSWNDLTSNDKSSSRTVGELLMKKLLEAKRFGQSMAVANDLAANGAARSQKGQFTDGGFELPPSAANVFGWQIKSIQQAQTALDRATHHGGAQSLRIQFQARAQVDFANVSQLVVVEPDAQYDLDCFIKTRELESERTPIVQIIDAAEGFVLASSPAAPGGDNDWQPLTASFKTGPKTEAVIIKLTRAQCEDVTLCPIFGTLWYDDFNLRRK